MRGIMMPVLSAARQMESTCILCWRFTPPPGHVSHHPQGTFHTTPRARFTPPQGTFHTTPRARALSVMLRHQLSGGACARLGPCHFPTRAETDLVWQSGAPSAVGPAGWVGRGLWRPRGAGGGAALWRRQ
eukprot:351497-Chlamydomonas_euryale.AAC.2